MVASVLSLRWLTDGINKNILNVQPDIGIRNLMQLHIEERQLSVQFYHSKTTVHFIQVNISPILLFVYLFLLIYGGCS